MPTSLEFKVTKNTIPMNLDRSVQQIRQSLTRALKTLIEIKRTEVVKRTPKDLGELRNSIHATNAERKGNAVSVSVVAGGVAAPYAIVQHENLQFKHTVGQAKYMESVFLESRASFADDLNKLIKF